MKNILKLSLLSFFTLLIIYFLAVLADFGVKKTSQSIVKESKKIFYEMKALTRDKGFKLKNYQPILINKMFLNDKNKIYHIGGQPKQKVFYCDEGYGLVKYESDRFGFRNDDNNWNFLNDKSKVKIMFVGDSFIHGACVHKEDVISTKIQSFDKEKIVTFNLGMAGNNAIMNAYAIKVFTNKIKPKYLIIGIHPNDRQKFLTDKYFSSLVNDVQLSKKYFDNNNENLSLSKELVNSIKKRNLQLNNSKEKYFTSKKNYFDRMLTHIKLDNLRKIILFYKEKYFFKLPKDTKLMINIANKECIINNCTPIFTFVPASKYWNNDVNQFIFRNSLREYLENNKNIFLDFSKIIKFDDKSYYSIKGGHVNPNTYNIISKEIYNELIN